MAKETKVKKEVLLSRLLGEKVRRSRLHQKLSLLSLGNKSDCSAPTIRCIEKGIHAVSWRVLSKVAKGLGESIVYLTSDDRPFKHGEGIPSQRGRYANPARQDTIVHTLARRRGMGLSELSKRSRVPLYSIYMLEGTPTEGVKVTTISRLAKALDMPFIKLIKLLYGDKL